MYQLRNLVNRHNIVTNPKENEAACEDFMITVTEAQILAAAMEIFEMDSLSGTPSGELDSLQRRNIFILATRQLVEKYFDLTISEKEGDGDRTIRCWKFLLPLLKATGRTNYGVEAIILLAQYYYLSSPRMAAQLYSMEQNSQHSRAYWQEHLVRSPSRTLKSCSQKCSRRVMLQHYR